MRELYRKIDSAIKDFYKTPKKALMLTGARQTGKTYAEHRALSGLMEGAEPYIKRAYVFSHSNIYGKERIIYAPIYMLMFMKPENGTPEPYTLDLSGL